MARTEKPLPEQPPATGLLVSGRVQRRWRKTFERFEKIFYEVRTDRGPITFVANYGRTPDETPAYLAIGEVGCWPVAVKLFQRRNGETGFELSLLQEHPDEF